MSQINIATSFLIPASISPVTLLPSNSQSITQMDSLELSQRVQIGDIEFFRNKNPDVFEANFLFNFCCIENASFEFIQQVVDLGVTLFDSGCALALENKHYELCLALLKQYGKTRKIQLINHQFFNYTALWLNMATYKPNHELMMLAIELMPNHTTPLFRGDKCYHKVHALTYQSIYAHLLKMFLGRVNAVEGDAQECILHMIICLSRKKFAIPDYLVRTIERYGLAYLFVNRLQPRQNLYEPAMADHVDLIQDKPDKMEVLGKKMGLYIELAGHFKIPASINSIMYKALADMIPKVLPNEEQFNFLKRLDVQDKKCALNFFRKYLDYDRALLHEKLNALPETNEDFNETIQKI